MSYVEQNRHRKLTHMPPTRILAADIPHITYYHIRTTYFSHHTFTPSNNRDCRLYNTNRFAFTGLYFLVWYTAYIISFTLTSNDILAHEDMTLIYNIFTRLTPLNVKPSSTLLQIEYRIYSMLCMFALLCWTNKINIFLTLIQRAWIAHTGMTGGNFGSWNTLKNTNLPSTPHQPPSSPHQPPSSPHQPPSSPRQPPSYITYSSSHIQYSILHSSYPILYITHALHPTPDRPHTLLVLDPEKGVCADPVEGDATLGVGGPGPPVGVSERQSSLDRGGRKTWQDGKKQRRWPHHGFRKQLCTEWVLTCLTNKKCSVNTFISIVPIVLLFQENK